MRYELVSEGIQTEAKTVLVANIGSDGNHDSYENWEIDAYGEITPWTDADRDSIWNWMV
jgi:hypothetical protein